ncbi:MAG: type II secretion system protein [Acidobacteriota bacterium]|nr:type II secretion system protein [Acidobacteriota bacterium]
MARLRIPRRAARARRGERGYMLLVLMIAVAIIFIGLSGAVYNVHRMILRDREVEMIHRGEQYERAIKRFYRKNGRYPSSIDQLENFNKLRYLRRRYTDPMAADGQWKIVRPSDIRITATGVTPVASTTSTSGSSGSDSSSQDPSGNGSSQAGSGSSSSGSDSSQSGSLSSGSSSGSSGSSSGSLLGGNNPTNGQVLGGDMYGVVSKSKKEGFHSYGGKTKFSEWFFIYAPSQDHGQLLVGPYNPKAFVGLTNSTGTKTSGTGSTTGTTGTTSTGTSGNGSSSGTGTSGTTGSTSSTGSSDGSSSSTPQQ